MLKTSPPHSHSPNTSDQNHQHLTTEALWQPELIRKYDLAGPRYTSYPTAAQFNEIQSNDEWLSAVKQSNEGAKPLSLYFHIPFCATVCYYCACNKIITANRQRALDYLHDLYTEIDLQSQLIEHNRIVTQMHWGGGTPSYINDQEMADLMCAIQKKFNLASDDSGEFSIEVHPAGISPERITYFRELGFNRLSLGIQDFDPKVQRAVNRFNSEEEVAKLVDSTRANQFHSLSMDLIYGLPLQTRSSFAQTLNRVIELAPDRLSLFSYAHMPHLFKTQKQINAAELPEPQEKLYILKDSIDTLLAAGYEYIGMDHFAKPDDELAIAQKNGTLHRNFQGYSTQQECDLVGLGLSSISSIGDTIFQNEKDITAYHQAISKSRLPLSKRIHLSRDDKIRRDVINQIICHFNLSFKLIEKKHIIDFKEYFSEELNILKKMETDGLISISNNNLIVNLSGRLLIRRICMVFDKYMDTSQPQKKHSRII